MQRFVENQDYDWIWSFHDLSFRDVEELHSIQEVWLRAAERRSEVGVGWLDSRDQRDVFSFRGKTGGGRHREDDLNRSSVGGSGSRGRRPGRSRGANPRRPAVRL